MAAPIPVEAPVTRARRAGAETAESTVTFFGFSLIGPRYVPVTLAWHNRPRFARVHPDSFTKPHTAGPIGRPL